MNMILMTGEGECRQVSSNQVGIYTGSYHLPIANILNAIGNGRNIAQKKPDCN